MDDDDDLGPDEGVFDGSAYRLRHVFRTRNLTGDLGDLSLSSRSLHVKLLLAIPASIVLGIIVAVIGVRNALELTAILSVFLITRSFYKGTPVSFGGYLVFAVLIVVVFLVAVILQDRMSAAMTASAGTILVFAINGRKPMEFFHQWLFARPGMEANALQSLHETTPRPSFVILTTLLLVIVFVPALHTVSLAILLVILLCISFIFLTVARGGRPVRSLRAGVVAATNIYTRYLAYPDADGIHVWNCGESLAKRRANFMFLWTTLAVTLAVGLSYCIPYELFGSWYESDFVWTIPPTFTHRSFDWITLPFALVLTASWKYWWALVIGAVLSFCLPHFILFTVYLPAILKIQRTADTAERDSKANDRRTLFQKYVDELKHSPRAIEIEEDAET